MVTMKVGYVNMKVYIVFIDIKTFMNFVALNKFF